MTEFPQYYAHSVEGRPEEEWEPLDLHLRHVAELGSAFAGVFGAGEWGRVAGLWHDLGKYRPEFQQRIRGERIQTEHAGAGAALAAERNLVSVAFAIAGHHAGLANRAAQGSSSVLPLTERITANHAPLNDIRGLIPPDILEPGFPELPSRLKAGSGDQRAQMRSLDFWTRMLFSALVDADFLATEHFYDAQQRQYRSVDVPIDDLRRTLADHLSFLDRSGAVNQLRNDVLERCVATAALGPGLFSLTVPTGGGKTLSSMAFALEHASRHALRRVIVAIPYTSIIEQNARVYRDVFGGDAVIEHHSNLDELKLHRSYGEHEVRRRLATENWDAPIIVTTNVQLFESIFASRPSRCRKLHSLAKSIIVLDEAQTLPPGFLLPVLDAIRELTDHYGCTVLLTTATQPALQQRSSLRDGLTNIREIVEAPGLLAQQLHRVEVHWPSSDTPTSWESLAQRLRQYRQLLVIVHRRKDAAELFDRLAACEPLHLSALMCPAHRLQVLEIVKRRLAAGEPCCLVATQVVESGVDIDFPVVFRAMAGLDSLVQAAGRCNREGKLRGTSGERIAGHFEVFRAQTSPPPGILRRGLEVMETMLRRAEPPTVLADPGWIEDYFIRLYMTVSLDGHNIQMCRGQLDFATAADEFRLIDNGAQSVVVPWDDGLARLERHRSWPSRETRRALQPYVVQLYRSEVTALVDRGALEEIAPDLFALTPPYHSAYHGSVGLRTDEQSDPERLVV